MDRGGYYLISQFFLGLYLYNMKDFILTINRRSSRNVDIVDFEALKLSK